MISTTLGGRISSYAYTEMHTHTHRHTHTHTHTHRGWGQWGLRRLINLLKITPLALVSHLDSSDCKVLAHSTPSCQCHSEHWTCARNPVIWFLELLVFCCSLLDCMVLLRMPRQNFEPFLSLFKNCLNVYLFLRERQSVSGGGAEREGDTQSEAGSRLWAVSTEPGVGLELKNHKNMTWAEVGRLPTEPPRHP